MTTVASNKFLQGANHGDRAPVLQQVARRLLREAVNHQEKPRLWLRELRGVLSVKVPLKGQGHLLQVLETQEEEELVADLVPEVLPL